MKTAFHSVRRSRTSAFTLVEMLIVIAIIALLAALTMGGYTYAMKGSRERTTRGTFESIKTALESYQTEFGEYPEPASTDKVIEFLPGKTYNVGGAACLYQALRGDGFDQIKGAAATSGSDAPAASDGRVDGTSEVKNVMLKEMPQSMYMNKNGVYVLIDGFARPFQYVKASTSSTNGSSGSGGSGGSGGNGAANDATTINSTYDLWSYSMDEMNTTKKSIDTLKDPKLGNKWIKNW